jgi:hypothetical protein
MFSFFRQTFHQRARTGTRLSAQPRAVRHLECETLEDRMLLSLTGAQLFAHSLPAADRAAMASAPDGRSVAVWQEPTSLFVAPVGQFHDIHAQLFDAVGHKVGGDILVAGDTENQYDPTVAMNASGEFVVAWTVDFSATDNDIHAALFNANGTRKAADFGVATTPKREFDASAGIAANGSFVISYTLQFDSGDQDVRAAMFDADAHKLRDIGVAVGAADRENNSHVTMTPGGSFAVSYLVNGASAVKFFSADGQPAGGEVTAQGHESPGQHQTPPHKRPHHTPPHKPSHHTPHKPAPHKPAPHKPAPHKPPHRKPPLHKPPHHTSPVLDGTLAGGYAVGAGSRDAGFRFDLAGIGDLAGVGESLFFGELHSLGLVRSGHAAGVVTLENSHGTIRLTLEGVRAQGAFAPLPQQFHFTVTSGTGAYSHSHASGTALLHLTPASHTLTLTLD